MGILLLPVLLLSLLQLVLDVRRLMRQLQSESADSSVDVVEMASRLSAMGYRVTVRDGCPPSCFRPVRPALQLCGFQQQHCAAFHGTSGTT